jgi:hypothetical protein
MREDIAYHIRRVLEKETAIFARARVISSGAKRIREIALRKLEAMQRDVSTSLDMT